MIEKKDVKLYSYQDTFSSMLLIVGVIVIIQYKQLETYNPKKSWSEHKGMRVQAHKMFYNLQHSAVPERVILTDSPAFPICTASLVSFPWRTDFSFFGRLAFFFSSASAPSSLFRGCISIAAPSWALAAAEKTRQGC